MTKPLVLTKRRFIERYVIMTNNSSINANMKNMKGLTLIELLVTVAIVSILIAVGLPGLQNTSQNSRVTSAINTLSGDIAFARSESVTRNVDVRIRSNSGGNDWSAGWIVETLGGAGAVTIRNAPALVNNILLTGTASSLTYSSDGTQNAGAELRFKACKNGDATPHGREIRVITTGRIKLVKGQNCP
jgi:type IV fimbrial biogenesis protein FimT